MYLPHNYKLYVVIHMEGRDNSAERIIKPDRRPNQIIPKNKISKENLRKWAVVTC
jgi:hypothetical protein